MSWQLIFLILGAVTSAYAVVLYLLLPDSPANAFFLKTYERAIAIQRTLGNKTGILDAGKFQTKQVLLALKDPQAWLLVTYMFCVNLCNGGITTVSSLSPNTSGYALQARNTDVHSSPPSSLKVLDTPHSKSSSSPCPPAPPNSSSLS